MCTTVKGTDEIDALKHNDNLIERYLHPFPRKARLLKKADFSSVFDGADKYFDRYFTILVRSNGLEHARLGMAISKKCARRAVDRNRLKRHVREIFRIFRQNLGAVDIVVMCRQLAITRKNRELSASLSKHFEKIQNRSWERS